MHCVSSSPSCIDVSVNYLCTEVVLELELSEQLLCLRGDCSPLWRGVFREVVEVARVAWVCHRGEQGCWRAAILQSGCVAPTIAFVSIVASPKYAWLPREGDWAGGRGGTGTGKLEGRGERVPKSISVKNAWFMISSSPFFIHPYRLDRSACSSLEMRSFAASVKNGGNVTLPLRIFS
jgi:hypothetical protein